MREADNGEEFIHRVKNEACLALEVFSGSEEASLIHTAVKNRVDPGEEQWILVDLGGGNVEVSLVDKNSILWSESHAIGSATDRENLQKIETVIVNTNGREILLNIRGRGDLLFERWALQRKSQYYSDIFGLLVKFKIER